MATWLFMYSVGFGDSDFSGGLEWNAEVSAADYAVIRAAVDQKLPLARMQELQALKVKVKWQIQEYLIEELKKIHDPFTMEALGYELRDGEWVYAHEGDAEFKPGNPFESFYTLTVMIYDPNDEPDYGEDML